QRLSSSRVPRAFVCSNGVRSAGRGGVSVMIATAVARFIGAGVLSVVLAAVSPAQAQQPSANAIALAREIITAQGGTGLYEPLVPQIIERARSIFQQSNPMLSKDLNDVAAKLRAELGPRVAELITDGATLYAAQFTEQELKDALAFYKSPLGRKIVA